MKLLYDPLPDETGFRFLVAGLPPGDRLLSVPGREIKGLATVEHGRIVIKVVSISDPDDVTTGVLREIPLGEIRNQLHRDILDHPELLSWATSGRVPDPENPFASIPVDPAERQAASERVASLAAKVGKRKPGTRGRVDPKFLHNIALLYIECYKWNPRAPSKELTQLLRARRGEASRNVREATVRDWVRQAREDGWLAPTGQGRAAAARGPRLRDEKEV